MAWFNFKRRPSGPGVHVVRRRDGCLHYAHWTGRKWVESVGQDGRYLPFPRAVRRVLHKWSDSGGEDAPQLDAYCNWWHPQFSGMCKLFAHKDSQ